MKTKLLNTNKCQLQQRMGPGASWLHRGLLDFYHIFVAFLTKTVPDGVHDGKDEVEAVTDVERDQDVVEAVSHFSPEYLIVEYFNMTYIAI